MLELAGAGDKSSKTDNNRVGKYTMSVAVRLTSVKAHRIRRFEQGGLINPMRTEAKQRLFSDHGIELIKDIAELEDKGINLAGIKTILEMRKGEGEKVRKI